MSSTINFLSACSGTHSEYPTEIRVRRDVLEMALDRFHDEVTEIRQREQSVFETLDDLLPQIFAAMMEKEMLSRSRTAVLGILETLSQSLFSSRPWCVLTSDTDVRSGKTFTDVTLALWFAEDLSMVLKHGKDLLDDYFGELVQCICDVESARSRLFSALDIPTVEPHGDMSWIRESKLDTSSVPPFTWPIPVQWRYLSLIPYLRRFVLQKCEKNISAKIARYCDQLTVMARRASHEWLSDIHWQLDQELSERTDGSLISAEISRQIRAQWRTLLSSSQRKTSPRVQSLYERIASFTTGDIETNCREKNDV